MYREGFLQACFSNTSVFNVPKKDDISDKLKLIPKHPWVQTNAYFQMPCSLGVEKHECLYLERAEGRNELNKISQHLGLIVEDVMNALALP